MIFSSCQKAQGGLGHFRHGVAAPCRIFPASYISKLLSFLHSSIIAQFNLLAFASSTVYPWISKNHRLALFCFFPHGPIVFGPLPHCSLFPFLIFVHYFFSALHLRVSTLTVIEIGEFMNQSLVFYFFLLVLLSSLELGFHSTICLRFSLDHKFDQVIDFKSLLPYQLYL